jgi:antitoxin (DNA-binding transcriptional repressor) of toxin-antitoxin stability system
MPQFKNPEGYYKEHFAWFPEWSVETPPGYSALYTHPLNRFELPFLTVSGIIDNDKVILPGSMPFFVKEGFVGIIEAGTPIAQIIPFKREDWESEYASEKPLDLARKNVVNSQKYRKPDGGVYKNEVWEPRKYL